MKTFFRSIFLILIALTAVTIRHSYAEDAKENKSEEGKTYKGDSSKDDKSEDFEHN